MNFKKIGLFILGVIFASPFFLCGCMLYSSLSYSTPTPTLESTEILPYTSTPFPTLPFTPTPGPSATLEPSSTPMPTLTPAPTIDTREEVYIDDVVRLSTDIISSMSNIQLYSTWLAEDTSSIYDDNFMGEFYGIIDEFKSYAIQLKNLDAPERFSLVHIKLTLAMNAYIDAADMLKSGLANIDVQKINGAVSLMETGTDYLAEATAALDTIN